MWFSQYVSVSLLMTGTHSSALEAVEIDDGDENERGYLDR